MNINIVGAILNDGPKPFKEHNVDVPTYEDFKKEFLVVQSELNSFYRRSGKVGTIESFLVHPVSDENKTKLKEWAYVIADEQFAQGIQEIQKLKENDATE